MTLKDCIDMVDNIKPNQYTIRDKVMWLSFIEEIIINEVMKTHEGYDGRYDNFEGYSEDRLTIPLAVPSPYDRLYIEYLKMMIDKENGETSRYNNSAMSYNTYMMEYRKHYNKTHMPLNKTHKRREMPVRKVTTGLTDAEYENLVKDMTYILTEYFGNSVSEDKLYDAVTKFAQNNLAMLKGKDGRDGVDGKDGYTPRKNIDYFDGAKGPKGDKGESGADGYTPVKGVDYFTPEEVEALKALVTSNRSYVNILGGESNWTPKEVKDDSGNVIGVKYGQRVNVNNATITKNSQVDLQINSDQMVIFREKDLAFAAENENGVITVYCVGDIPKNDYTIQAIVTEVTKNG